MYRATVCDYLGAFWLVCFRVAPQTVSASGSQHYPLDGGTDFSLCFEFHGLKSVPLKPILPNR
jgi:hypothetical protein